MARADTDLTPVRLALATGVMLSHAFAFLHLTEPMLFHKTLGRLSVLGFFLLSGYVISSSWKRRPVLAAFAIRRALRILPGFFVAFVLSIIIFFLACQLQRHVTPRLDWLGLAGQFLLVLPPTVIVGQVVEEPNGQLWSISWELICYALTPLVFRIASKWTIGLLYGVLFCLLATRPNENTELEVLMFTCFLSGGILSKYRIPYLKTPKIPDVSYGLYLYGWPIELFVSYWVRSPAPLFLISTPLICVAAYISHKFIERPCMESAARWVDPGPGMANATG
jgi:peptidoglycan/LPS O-acetylase OafA/YrhL